jgi:hypothetical protein
VGFVNQEGDAQLLQFGVLFDLFQPPGELLLRGDEDRLAPVRAGEKLDQETPRERGSLAV